MIPYIFYGYIYKYVTAQKKVRNYIQWTHKRGCPWEELWEIIFQFKKIRIFSYFTWKLKISSFSSCCWLPLSLWPWLTYWSALNPSCILKHIKCLGTSLVAQWLRICLPMQGTQVWVLVREDPTCCGATKPVCHNYWGWVPQLLKPARLEPELCNKSPQQWEAHAPHWRVDPARSYYRKLVRSNEDQTTKTQCSQK